MDKMFDKLKITKAQAEEHVIGMARAEFIKDLDRLEELLLKWAVGDVGDKSLAFHMIRKIDSIKRSVTIYK